MFKNKAIWALIIMISLAISLFGQYSSLDWKVHNAGKVRQLITNMGTLDNSYEVVSVAYRGLLYCEMPPGSNEEHVFQGGIWIGGITPQGDTLVSVTRTHFTRNEFFPSAEPWDTVWVVSEHDSADIPYWPNYHGVSDQDFVCRYSDDNVTNIPDHFPLHLTVIQRSYAWSNFPEFIVFNYDVIATKTPLQDVYFGFWLHGEIGNNDVANNFIDENTMFFPEQELAVAEDAQGGEDGTARSPIAIKILAPIDSTKKFTYKWYNHEDLNGFGRDGTRYRLAMASGEHMQDRPESERAHISICFGPFENVAVGDTLHFELAEVFADLPGVFGIGRVGRGIDSLLKRVEGLELLRSKGYRLPFPPPKPKLRYKIASHQITLNWKPQPGDPDPEHYQDPYRGDQAEQPFEGYRVYKSTQSENGPWTLLAEFDLAGDPYESNTGLQWEYTDVGLLNNFDYYYTVAAFSKPDEGPPPYPSQESSLNDNSIIVSPGTASPPSVGQVAVVPNPYRGDIAYHEYNPQWEKPSGNRQLWMEQDRRLQFINLPARCEIKIYTLGGDLVNTIRHDNPNKGFEDWNLTSSVGQAIASGIYLFTVEDQQNGKVQVGKFVVIK
jgi:hypothetical protein